MKKISLLNLVLLTASVLPGLAAEVNIQPTSRDVEVIYTNAADRITLAGTLSLPANCRACPAILMITGSGPQDRDETIGELKPC